MIKHTFKTKKGITTRLLSPIKAIRQKCLDCSNWQESEIRNCTIEDCALFSFRFGKTSKEQHTEGDSRLRTPSKRHFFLTKTFSEGLE